jgi:hypothetical protein
VIFWLFAPCNLWFWDVEEHAACLIRVEVQRARKSGYFRIDDRLSQGQEEGWPSRVVGEGGR